jgi:hypothetical protein
MKQKYKTIALLTYRFRLPPETNQVGLAIIRSTKYLDHLIVRISLGSTFSTVPFKGNTQPISLRENILKE